MGKDREQMRLGAYAGGALALVLSLSSSNHAPIQEAPLSGVIQSKRQEHQIISDKGLNILGHTIYQDHYLDDLDWKVEIKNCDEKNICHSGEIYVTPELFGEIEPGDVVDFTGLDGISVSREDSDLDTKI